MRTAVKKIFQRKSEVVMLLAGISILVSVGIVATSESFIFWQLAKGFYGIGVLLILFDR